MIIDVNKIRSRTKTKIMDRPKSGIFISRFNKKSPAAKLSERFSTLFGALILIAITIGGAYLIWTLVSQSSRYIEIQAEKSNAETAPYDKSATYEITYKPSQK